MSNNRRTDDFYRETYKDLKRYSSEEFCLENKQFSKSFPKSILKIFFEFDNEQIEEVLDGLERNDDSIDAFWINHDEKNIVICQFKSKMEYKENSHTDKKDIVFFNTCIETITNSGFSSKNLKINEISEIISQYQKTYTIYKYFFNLGFYSEDIINNYFTKSETSIYYNQNQILEEFYNYNTSFDEDFLDEIEINIDYSAFQSTNEVNQVLFFSPSSKYKTIIFPVTAFEIYKLISQHGKKIFERNVRLFLPNNNINKGIKKTLNYEPQNFYFYNNGIIISCNKFEKKGNSHNLRLNLNNPQIINGAQTTNSIYHFAKDFLKNNNNDEDKLKEHLSKALILCKVIESTKGDETEFSKKIAIYSNSQSKVNLSDFYSNNPEQNRLKENLEKFNISYQIKRGDKDILKNPIIKINLDSLVETLASQNSNPFDSKPSNLLEFHDEKNIQRSTEYIQMFGDKKTDITDEKTLNICFSIYIYKSVLEIASVFRDTINIFNNIISNGYDEKLANEISDTFFSLSNLNKSQIIGEIKQKPNKIEIYDEIYSQKEMLKYGNKKIFQYIIFQYFNIKYQNEQTVKQYLIEQMFVRDNENKFQFIKNKIFENYEILFNIHKEFLNENKKNNTTSSDTKKEILLSIIKRYCRKNS